MAGFDILLNGTTEEWTAADIAELESLFPLCAFRAVDYREPEKAVDTHHCTRANDFAGVKPFIWDTDPKLVRAAAAWLKNVTPELARRWEAKREAQTALWRAEELARAEQQRQAGLAQLERRRERGRPSLTGDGESPPRSVRMTADQWAWLDAQEGGASAALRRLVDAAKG